MVSKYFEKIGKIISGFQEIINSQTISKKIFNDTQGLISGEINFTNESELSFMELKNSKQKNKKNYKYHYMDNTKNMIFRYDNAKHHQEIKTFPHHKHIYGKIENNKEPELIDILSEIQAEIMNNNEIK